MRTNDDRLEDIEIVLSELTDDVQLVKSVEQLWNIMGPLIEICRWQEDELKSLRRLVNRIKSDALCEDW